jgi:hypothetical protein
MSLLCHPGLDPGSTARSQRLQWASLNNGSRVFARDDKENDFARDDKENG